MTQKQFLTDPSEIRAWLKKYAAIEGTYNILDNGKIDVDGNVAFDSAYGVEVTTLPCAFNTVSGSFNSSSLRMLESCDGFPQECTILRLSNNIKLTSLVGGVQRCKEMEILGFGGTNMQGAPEADVIHLHWSPHLKDLTGLPDHCQYLSLQQCPGIVNLEGIPKTREYSRD